jgi:hydrogenase maturation protease
MTERAVGILGIGNLLLGDEGFGVHVIRHLEDRYAFPDNVKLLDGGTAGIYLAPFFEDLDCLIVIDALAMDTAPGTVHTFTGPDLSAGLIQMRMSPHQVGILEIIEICRLREQAPQTIHFIGVVPKDVSTGTRLSRVLAPKVEKVAGMVLARLRALGLSAVRLPEATHA